MTCLKLAFLRMLTRYYCNSIGDCLDCLHDLISLCESNTSVKFVIVPQSIPNDIMQPSVDCKYVLRMN